MILTYILITLIAVGGIYDLVMGILMSTQNGISMLLFKVFPILIGITAIVGSYHFFMTF